MNTTEEKNGAFPDGFEHVQERLNETTKHLQQLDDQIKSIPKEKGPTLEYRPPHFVGRVIPGSRDKARIALEEKQQEIKLDALNQTEADTRGVDNKSGRVVRDRVREQLFPNPYKKLSPEDRLDQKGVAKEIEQSQDYMDAMFTKPDKSPATDKQATDQVKSMSMRFMQGLSYNRAGGKTDKSRDRDKDMDRD